MTYVFEAGCVTFFTNTPITIQAEDMESAEAEFIAHMAEGGQFCGFRAMIAQPGRETELSPNLDAPSDKPHVPRWEMPGQSMRLRKRAERYAAKKAEALANLAKKPTPRKKRK